MASIALESISYAYDATANVLNNINLTLNDGELHTLLGSSGCGKTTLLRIIAGFLPPNEGRVLADGKDVTKLPPEKRHMGVVFQNYALFPQMSVEDNVAYGLRAAHVRKDECARRVQECLDLVDMTDFAKRNAMELSGGQQQRVALARALVMEPSVLLLDEPLSNLDAELRQRMRNEIRRIQQHVGITTMFITHDRQEALSLSDRISVIRDGVIEQTGTPQEVYEHPQTPFVASFVGMANALTLLKNGKPEEVLLKPEELQMTAAPTDKSFMEGTVTSIQYVGFASTYTVDAYFYAPKADSGKSTDEDPHNQTTTLTVLSLDNATSTIFKEGDHVWVEVIS